MYHVPKRSTATTTTTQRNNVDVVAERSERFLLYANYANKHANATHAR